MQDLRNPKQSWQNYFLKSILSNLSSAPESLGCISYPRVQNAQGGVFCTLGYIILQDSLFLGDLVNLIFQNKVLKCFPGSPDDGDYRPPILAKWFFEIHSVKSVQWTSHGGEYFVPYDTQYSRILYFLLRQSNCRRTPLSVPARLLQVISRATIGPGTRTSISDPRVQNTPGFPIP